MPGALTVLMEGLASGPCGFSLHLLNQGPASDSSGSPSFLFLRTGSLPRWDPWVICTLDFKVSHSATPEDPLSAEPFFLLTAPII